MANSIDERVVTLGIEIDGSGTITWYENYYIQAKGMKTTSSMCSDTEITIRGIKKETQNYILTKCAPGNIGLGKKVTVYLLAGRESYGASLYFKGDVYRAYPAAGKPDIGISLKCLTGYSNKRITVQRGGTNELTLLSQIAKWVANDCGYALSFEITDAYIRSYSFTGSAHGSMENLEKLANAEVFIDNDTLYVKETGTKAKGKVTYSVNSGTAENLISAQATESGVSVKMLFHPSVTVGSVINLESELNPAINGQYTVMRVTFDIAKHSQEFYLTVEALSYA